jgi:hypothetical protein
MTRLANLVWLLLAVLMLASFALLLVAPPDPPNRPRHGTGPSPAATPQPASLAAPAASSVQIAGAVQSYTMRIVTVRPSHTGASPDVTRDPSYAVIISPATQVVGHCSIATALAPRMPVTLSVPAGGNGALMASTLVEATHLCR